MAGRPRSLRLAGRALCACRGGAAQPGGREGAAGRERRRPPPQPRNRGTRLGRPTAKAGEAREPTVLPEAVGVEGQERIEHGEDEAASAVVEGLGYGCLDTTSMQSGDRVLTQISTANSGARLPRSRCASLRWLLVAEPHWHPRSSKVTPAQACVSWSSHDRTLPRANDRPAMPHLTSSTRGKKAKGDTYGRIDRLAGGYYVTIPHSALGARKPNRLDRQ